MRVLWAILMVLCILCLFSYGVLAVAGIMPGGLVAIVVSGALILLLGYFGQKAEQAGL